jgi:hypothetical protein
LYLNETYKKVSVGRPSLHERTSPGLTSQSAGTFKFRGGFDKWIKLSVDLDLIAPLG